MKTNVDDKVAGELENEIDGPMRSRAAIRVLLRRCCGKSVSSSGEGLRTNDAK